MRFWRPRVSAKELTVAAVFAAAIAMAPSAAHAQFGASFDLSTLDGTNGFVINGIDSSDHSGSAVSGAGDVNGDGIDDLIIGAPGADPNRNSMAGESYVVFGKNSGFSSLLNLRTLNGSNGFVINGIDAGDDSGCTVSGAGDVNGDGINDLIIGASRADPNGNSTAGESYVLFGNNSGFSSSLNLSTLDGTNGFVINGIDAGDRSGGPVSGAGDVNGDGLSDLIIGGSSAGESYVVFGQSSGFSSSLNLSALDGSNGFSISGRSAVSVSGAGDINGDGIDDVIIGAPFADPNGNSEAGESYVVFGSNSGFSSSLDLNALDGTNGFVINGIDANDFSGNSVSGAGDVNGDGLDDLIIGATFADSNGNSYAGESYVVFGSNSGFSSSLDLSTLDGANGLTFSGANSNDFSGRSVSSAGDINGDGIDDVTISGGVDEDYVVFGSNSGFSSSLDLSTLDGTNGFVISGTFPSSVSGAGDINADGIDDLIIGESGADPNGNSRAGVSYVVFGRAASPVLKGDVDMDGDIDFSDIPPFISVLQSGVFQAEADCDCSTVVDFADIPAFINILQEQ